MEEKELNLLSSRLALSYLIIFCLGLLLGWAYFSDSENLEINNLEEINQPMHFVLDDLKLGQRFGDLRLVAIEEYNPKTDLATWENVRLDFDGNLELQGTYHQVFDTLCFEPREKDKRQIPIMNIPGGQSRASFCFSNTEEARQQLSNVDFEQELQIVISDFSLISYPSEVGNLAKLVEVK